MTRPPRHIVGSVHQVLCPPLSACRPLTYWSAQVRGVKRPNSGPRLVGSSQQVALGAHDCGSLGHPHLCTETLRGHYKRSVPSCSAPASSIEGLSPITHSDTRGGWLVASRFQRVCVLRRKGNVDRTRCASHLATLHPSASTDATSMTQRVATVQFAVSHDCFVSPDVHRTGFVSTRQRVATRRQSAAPLAVVPANASATGHRASSKDRQRTDTTGNRRPPLSGAEAHGAPARPGPARHAACPCRRWACKGARYGAPALLARAHGAVLKQDDPPSAAGSFCGCLEGSMGSKGSRASGRKRCSRTLIRRWVYARKEQWMTSG